MDLVINEINELIIQCMKKAKKTIGTRKNKCFRISVVYNEKHRTISAEAFVTSTPDIKLEKQVQTKITAFTEEHLMLLREVFEAGLNQDTTGFWEDSVALSLKIHIKEDSGFICPFTLRYGSIYEAEHSFWEKKTINGNTVYVPKTPVIVPDKAPETVCDEPVLENEFVMCTVNTPESKIIFTVKNECQNAYEAMLEFLINQIKSGFSRKYAIELESDKKDYLPDVARTDTNSFFANCGKYSGLFPLLREYFKIALKEWTDYTDTYDAEEIMPCGGYAAFTLGLANSENFDIVSEFMQNHDSEHIIAPRYLVYHLIDNYGWSENTVNVFCDCVYYGNNVFAEAKNLSEEVLDGILTYAKEHNFKNHQTEMLANGIWEDFEDEMEKATGKAAEIFSQLADEMK